MKHLPRPAALILAIALNPIGTCVMAQNHIKTAPPTVACPSPQEVAPLHVYGLWQAELYAALPTDLTQPPTTAPSSRGTLQLERHPEHPDSLSGRLSLHAGAKNQGTRAPMGTAAPDSTAWVAGDLEDGELIMDESDDGKRIAAVWVGVVVGPSCGQEIRGTRRLAGEDQGQAFILKKQPGWR